MFSIFVVVLLSVNIKSQSINNETYSPIVLWHGMGDSCCFPFSMGQISKELKNSLPGVYVKSLKIGKSIVNDMENGYFMHPDDQVKMACKLISEDPELSQGYNAIGFSQGAQFLRAVAQRCPDPPIKNLISMGGQHQGVYGLPNCGSLSHVTCDYIRRLLNYAAYERWAQKTLAQATYWHDPLNEELYKNYSTFLAEINNERTINQKYVDNLLKLKNFIMIKFENDTIVQPVDTEWFGFYKPGQAKETEDLRSSTIYKEDRLGLKQLDDDSRLQFFATPGNHLEFDWPWFEEKVIEPYLKEIIS